jgi:predicted outer membrane repeat protein
VASGGTSFTGNTAEYGGGLDVGDDYATVVGDSFQHNSASDDGGGIYADADYVTLANNSITDNSAPSGDGGGVYNDYTAASVVLVGTNRIFWNSGGNCAPTNAVNGCTG